MRLCLAKGYCFAGRGRKGQRELAITRREAGFTSCQRPARTLLRRTSGAGIALSVEVELRPVSTVSASPPEERGAWLSRPT